MRKRSRQTLKHNKPGQRVEIRVQVKRLWGSGDKGAVTSSSPVRRAGTARHKRSHSAETLPRHKRFHAQLGERRVFTQTKCNLSLLTCPVEILSAASARERSLTDTKTPQPRCSRRLLPLLLKGQQPAADLHHPAGAFKTVTILQAHSRPSPSCQRIQDLHHPFRCIQDLHHPASGFKTFPILQAD